MPCGGAGESKGQRSGLGAFAPPPPAALGPESGRARFLRTEKPRCVHTQSLLALEYRALRKTIEYTLLEKCPQRLLWVLIPKGTELISVKGRCLKSW